MAEDNAQILANSMIGIHGRNAVQAAKEYAVRHKHFGDSRNHAVWLHLAGVIEKQLTERCV